MASSTPLQPTITAVPPPWTLRGTIYTFATYISSSSAKTLSQNPSFLYAPLEANSLFADGKAVGGLGMVQVIRYTESPVGPYDELVIVPGKFEREELVASSDSSNGGNSGQKMVRKQNLRCTKIYVSSKETCWNGRKNWNIPKHLATFTFTTLANNTISISVQPYVASSTTGIDVAPSPSSTPFFSATFKTIPYLPSFPLSTGVAKYIGMDLALVQPPLIAGKNEVAGTEGEGWCKVDALEWAKVAKIGWWDLKQVKTTEGERQPLLDGDRENVGRDLIEGELHGSFKNWWPGAGRWHVGVVMEDAVIEFPAGKRWLS